MGQKILHQMGIAQWVPRQSLPGAKRVVSQSYYEISIRDKKSFYFVIEGARVERQNAFVTALAKAFDGEASRCQLSEIGSEATVLLSSDEISEDHPLISHQNLFKLPDLPKIFFQRSN